MDQRQQQLTQWLKSQIEDFQLIPLAGDASFRRYFRVHTHGQNYIAMDAPTHLEDCHPFVMLARILKDVGLHVPDIFAQELQSGFLLCEDLGDAVYHRVLNVDNADSLYKLALDKLLLIQSITFTDLPLFHEEPMLFELENFHAWFLTRHLQISLSPTAEKMLFETFCQLIESATNQPQVFIHRDYHSRNLMALPDDVGILDFQDAALGPITYDLVSLLRDCYIEWPLDQITSWCRYFYDAIEHKQFSFETFSRWFDWMGIQRQLKAIFIFARKLYRDQDPTYMPDIDRGLHYILSVAEHYPELALFVEFLKTEVMPVYVIKSNEINRIKDINE